MFEDFSLYLDPPQATGRRIGILAWFRRKAKRPPLNPHLLKDIGHGDFGQSI
ncbi:hypothetical protein [Devosia sp. CAU 1758]